MEDQSLDLILRVSEKHLNGELGLRAKEGVGAQIWVHTLCGMYLSPECSAPTSSVMCCAFRGRA